MICNSLLMKHLTRFKHYEMSKIFSFKTGQDFEKYIKNQKENNIYNMHYFEKNGFWNKLDSENREKLSILIQRTIRNYEDENIHDIFDGKYLIFPQYTNRIKLNIEKYNYNTIEIFNFYGKLHGHYLHLT